MCSPAHRVDKMPQLNVDFLKPHGLFSLAHLLVVAVQGDLCLVPYVHNR